LREFIGILVFCCITVNIFGQDPANANYDIDINQQLIEDYFEALDIEGDFDFNTIFEVLEYRLEKPLNLNQAEAEDLKELIVLNDLQINNLIQYRQTNGDLISLYELQSIPGFDVNVIRILLPFVTVGETLADFHLPFFKMFSGGKHEVYLKWRRVLEEQKGYIPDEEGNTKYLGDPNKLYLRYKYSFDNKFQFGITAEKDAGEEFFSGNNKQGFDYYSAHMYARNFNRHIKAIAIGDYSISLGQGLIIHNAFGASKGSYTMDVKKSGRVIKPYTSVSEFSFYRGIATTVRLGNKIELTLFGSSKKRDASVTVDTLQGDQILRFSSLLEDGNHRTQSEINRERQLRQNSAGGSIKYKSGNFNIALNYLYENFDKKFEKQDRLYNLFAFTGDQLQNVSLSYGYQMKNLNFFGEIAISDNGALANLHGLMIGLDPKMSLSIVYRDFARDYHALNQNPFADSQSGINERGVYIGTEISPAKGWKINAYADFYSFPWFKFGVDGPSKNYDYLIKVAYKKKRKYEAYVQFVYENKELNSIFFEDYKIDRIDRGARKRLRLQFSNKITKAIELRNRVEFSFSDLLNINERGFLIYQDIIYKPIASPFSFSARYALFDTDAFNSRIYAYENDILYEFFIPFYFHKGSRIYLNLRYKITRNITTEFRFAQTYLENRDIIGSGNDLIDGNVRTELKAQLKLKF
jgi:hypothetical protein